MISSESQLGNLYDQLGWNGKVKQENPVRAGHSEEPGKVWRGFRLKYCARDPEGPLESAGLQDDGRDLG